MMALLISILAGMMILMIGLIVYVLRQNQLTNSSTLSTFQQIQERGQEQQQRSSSETLDQFRQLMTDIVLGRQQLIQQQDSQLHSTTKSLTDFLGPDLTSLQYLTGLPDHIIQAMHRDGLQNRMTRQQEKPYDDLPTPTTEHYRSIPDA